MMYFLWVLLLVASFIGTAAYAAVSPSHDGVIYPKKDVIPPPLQQLDLGIKKNHVICDSDKSLAWGMRNPVCVYPGTEGELIKRGWAKLRYILPAGPDPVKELELTGQNEISYQITGNLRIGDETYPLSDDRIREIVWEYSQKYHKGEEYVEYAIVPSQNYYDVGDSVAFELLEWGHGYDCWSLSVRILDVDDKTAYEDDSMAYCIDASFEEGRDNFRLYSVGVDLEEFTCIAPGFYRVEVSNGDIFPADILETFACLKNDD